jgi:type IV pilus assembly protein PilN
MRITLNLATRPYADEGPAIKRLRIGMLVLVVILGLLGLGVLHFHQTALRMAAQEAAIDQSIAQIRQEEQGYQVQMQQPDNAKVLTQAEFLNQLFEEKTFSWTAAMEDLERVLPLGVQVTAIEPNRGKDGRLTLRLRVSGQRERSVEMLRNMEHSRRFIAPRISAENTENSSSGSGDVVSVKDAGKVSFDVLAEYNPATLDERKAAIARQKVHPMAAAVPQSMQPVVRPQYVPPIAQPARRTSPVPQARPVPGQAPMPGRARVRGMAQPPEVDMPTGFDPNGLKNHDQNRIPRPGDLPPPQSQEDPK